MLWRQERGGGSAGEREGEGGIANGVEGRGKREGDSAGERVLGSGEEGEMEVVLS